MTDLRFAYDRFAEAFAALETADGISPFPLASQRLRQYSDDPNFWLQYALICLAEEDYREGSLALAQAGTLIEEWRITYPDAPGLSTAVEALLRDKLDIYTQMLRIVVRGNPAGQPELVRNLQRLAELRIGDIKSGLATAATALPVSTGENPEIKSSWALQVERLIHRYRNREAAEDLNTLHDLIFALMGAGRYGEAEQLLKIPPFMRAGSSEALARFCEWYPLLLDWLKDFRQDPLRRLAPFEEPLLGHRYVLPIVVWGDPYLDSLEQFTLPSLLAQGNLPYLREAGEVRLIFFTTNSGAQRLEQMPIFLAVKQLVAVDVVTFPNELMDRPDIYKLMSAMHLVCMEIAKASHAHFFFLAPDLVFANNFMQTVDRRLRQGAEVVFLPGLILQMESFKEEQLQRFPTANQTLSFTPSELLALGMRHLHPFVKLTYTYTPNGHRSTVAVFMWPLADGGCIVHGYHHTPFLISAPVLSRFDGSMFQNIDGDFLPKILRSKEEVERCTMISDPTETTYFELSRSHRFGTSTGTDLGEFDLGAFDIGRLSRWGALLGVVAQWLLPQKSCFDPAGKSHSDPAHAASARVVEDILQGMKTLEREADHLPLKVGITQGDPLSFDVDAGMDSRRFSDA